jgi:hypothetical protein
MVDDIVDEIYHVELVVEFNVLRIQRPSHDEVSHLATFLRSL